MIEPDSQVLGKTQSLPVEAENRTLICCGIQASAWSNACPFLCFSDIPVSFRCLIKLPSFCFDTWFKSSLNNDFKSLFTRNNYLNFIFQKLHLKEKLLDKLKVTRHFLKHYEIFNKQLELVKYIFMLRKVFFLWLLCDFIVLWLITENNHFVCGIRKIW